MVECSRRKGTSTRHSRRAPVVTETEKTWNYIPNHPKGHQVRKGGDSETFTPRAVDLQHTQTSLIKDIHMYSDQSKRNHSLYFDPR